MDRGKGRGKGGIESAYIWQLGAIQAPAHDAADDGRNEMEVAKEGMKDILESAQNADGIASKVVRCSTAPGLSFLHRNSGSIIIHTGIVSISNVLEKERLRLMRMLPKV